MGKIEFQLGFICEVANLTRMISENMREDIKKQDISQHDIRIYNSIMGSLMESIYDMPINLTEVRDEELRDRIEEDMVVLGMEKLGEFNLDEKVKKLDKRNEQVEVTLDHILKRAKGYEDKNKQI